MDLERVRRLVALEWARKILQSADFSAMQTFTEEQNWAFMVAEQSYCDGLISYFELWDMCPKIPLPRE